MLISRISEYNPVNCSPLKNIQSFGCDVDGYNNLKKEISGLIIEIYKNNKDKELKKRLTKDIATFAEMKKVACKPDYKNTTSINNYIKLYHDLREAKYELAQFNKKNPNDFRTHLEQASNNKQKINAKMSQFLNNLRRLKKTVSDLETMKSALEIEILGKAVSSSK